MLLNKITNRVIQSSETLLNALKLMDRLGVKLLFVYENEHFLSILTIGDIQRAIIAGVDLQSKVLSILDLNKIYASVTDSNKEIRQKMTRLRAECMPILNNEKELVDVKFWKELFEKDFTEERNKINLPVVIMAGGKGTRLQPLTNIYPKPLIPVGEKTIIESIMDRFLDYGCDQFHISVNYKADMIENYFNFVNNPNYHISYFQENKPMGTAGSLRLLKDKINSTFFVSNCDILINERYHEILKYHCKNNNELTVVAALVTYSIPYGTIIAGENGLLESIEEKPNLSFKINTGLYIIEPSVLNQIPDDFFHITHLMEKLQSQGRRVGVYPISKTDWMDMGDWTEYLKLINVK